MSIRSRLAGRVALVAALASGVLALLPAPSYAVGDVSVSFEDTALAVCSNPSNRFGSITGELFTAPVSGYLRTVALAPASNRGAVDRVVSIRDADLNVLDSQTVSLGNSRTLVDVAPTKRIEVTAGKQYGVDFSGSCGDQTGVYGPESQTNSYGGIAFRAYTGAGYDSRDIAFRVVVTDDVQPSVTVNRVGSGPARPSQRPIHFTARFSEGVGDFREGDVTVMGTSATPIVTPIGTDGRTYGIEIDPPEASGTVTVSIAAGVASDAQGNPNTASDNTGNTNNSVQFVGQETQTITFTSTPPNPARVQDPAYTATATGGGSGNPVVLAAGPSTVCTSTTSQSTNGVASTQVSFVGAGTCGITANQAGNADYTAAPQQTQFVQVSKVVNESFAGSQSQALVSGQSFGLTGSVSSQDGVAQGTAQFLRDGQPVGSPITVSQPGVVSGPAISLTAGQHQIDLRFTPSNGTRYDTGTPVPQTYTVEKAGSTTALAVAADRLSAQVAVVAPGAGDPTGTVDFQVDGRSVGTAPVVGGRAELAYSTPPGGERSVVAIYSGDAQLLGSRSDAARRGDPAITALVVSNRAVTRFGWYRARPTVSFTCTPGSARLTGPCPGPVAVTTEGIQQITRTVTGADGGSASVSIAIAFDETDPVARIRGFAKGRPRCAGTDAVSGVASCRLRRTTLRDGRERLTAIVRDRAGNVDRAVRVVRGA